MRAAAKFALFVGEPKIGAKNGSALRFGSDAFQARGNLTFDLAETSQGLIGGLTQGEIRVSRPGKLNATLTSLEINFDTGEISGDGHLSVPGSTLSISGNVLSEVQAQVCVLGGRVCLAPQALHQAEGGRGDVSAPEKRE